MATEATNATTDSTSTATKPGETTAKRGPKAARPKAKMRKPSQSAKARQKLPERNLKGSGDAKQSPYRVGSCYMAIIDALRRLGIGRVHSWDKIVSTVELPKGFKSKDGLGWKDRVVQNTRVLTRKDYGFPCRKVLKMEVRTDGSSGAGLFKL